MQPQKLFKVLSTGYCVPGRPYRVQRVICISYYKEILAGSTNSYLYPQFSLFLFSAKAATKLCSLVSAGYCVPFMPYQAKKVSIYALYYKEIMVLIFCFYLYFLSRYITFPTRFASFLSTRNMI